MSSTASAPTERRGARRATRIRRGERHPEGLERLRILLAGAMGAILVGYALLVPVAVLLLASGGSGSLDGAFSIAVPMWLAAHQIPVEVEGRALGVLPLLPTVILVVVVAAAAGWSARRLGGRIRHDAGPVVAVQAGAAAVVAVLAGALLPGDVSVTTPWASMVGAGLLAGLAAGVGVLRTCGPPPEWTRLLSGWPRAALVGARAGAAGLLLSGAVVVLLALVVRAGAVADSFAGLAPGAGAAGGVLLLAVGYLPNTLVAGMAWALGPGFAVGAAEYGPFGADAGTLPPFPLFAAVPTEPVPGWAAVVLLLPVGVGVAAGLVCRRALGTDAPLRERVSAAAGAAGVTAVGACVLAAVAGGSLAGGPYDPVSLSPVGVLLTALALLGVPATIAAAGVDDLMGLPSSTRRPSGDRSSPSVRRMGASARSHDEGAARARGEGATRSRRPQRDGGRRDGAGRNGPEATGSGREGSGASERASRTKPAREKPAGEKPAHGGSPGDDPAPQGTARDSGRDGASRDRTAGPSRDVSTRSGSGGARRGSTGRAERDDAARPRTVGDLVAQQESARAADDAGAPDTEVAEADGSDVGHRDGRDPDVR